jgi:hypothetical protein
VPFERTLIAVRYDRDAELVASLEHPTHVVLALSEHDRVR